MASSSSRALRIWMNGEPVGRWSANRSGNSIFQYDADWLDSPHVRALSLSLPILPGNQPHSGDKVDSWFDNLLPEAPAVRARLARRFHVSPTSFELLAAIGRDCVGAVQIATAGHAPVDVQHIDAEPLRDSDVALLLRSVTSTPSFGTDERQDDFRISIAGAQEKTALLLHEGRWHRPHGTTPTTHMLKLPLGLVGNMRMDLRDSVENEWLCMHFLERLGLPVAETSMATFSDEVSQERVLVVKRFDRRQVPATADSPSWIMRLPQEDFCQATGTPASRKYESDGGPGIRQSLELLASSNAPDDTLVFAKSQLAFWLLAATDGHAKNFSIFLRRDGYVMTPLYDVLSAWPIIGHGVSLLPVQKVELAMGLRGKSLHRGLQKIRVHHWRALASHTGIAGAFDQMTAMVEGAENALVSLEAGLPREFPEPVWSAIAHGVRDQRKRFLAALL